MYINPLIQGALWLELQACNSSMILGNIHYGSSMCHRDRPLVKTPAVLGIFHLEQVEKTPQKIKDPSKAVDGPFHGVCHCDIIDGWL